ncbi:hypothetical protein DMENIID0001_171220 [Sergentomyia squamirostris]
MEALMDANWELTIPLRHQSFVSTPWEVQTMLGFAVNNHSSAEEWLQGQGQRMPREDLQQYFQAMKKFADFMLAKMRI